MKSIIPTLTLTIILSGVFAQVTQSDIRTFGYNLNQRRLNIVGLNPFSPDYIQLTIKDPLYGGAGIEYKGVKAISERLILMAYPEEKMGIAINHLTTIDKSKPVFDKFILQIFFAVEADKENTIDLLSALCGNLSLANRIYENFKKEYANEISSIKIKVIEESDGKPIVTFSIPIKDDKPEITYKYKNISTIIFKAKGVQFENLDGNKGSDSLTNFEISIDKERVKLIWPKQDAFVVEDYFIDSSAMDNENKKQIFWLKDGYQVRRNSFMSPAKVEYTFEIYWSEVSGYILLLKSIKGTVYRIFNNLVTIKK